MSDKQNISFSRVEPLQAVAHVQSSRAAPAWWIVFTKELSQLWMGGKAPILLFCYCVLQGALTYFMVSNISDPTPPKEMVYFTLENAIAFGVLIGLIIGADSISGERERLTLESLLLTPVGSRQILIGKFFAGISPWFAGLAITIPLLAVLAQGDEILGPAVFWGSLVGSLLALSFAGLGMLVSSWSNSNKTSVSVSLTLYIVSFIPTQLQGGAQKGAMGYLLKRVNPMESVNHFLENVLVNNRTPKQMGPWLRSPILFAVLVFGLLFLFAGSALHLEAGKTNKLWTSLRGAVGLVFDACFFMISLGPF